MLAIVAPAAVNAQASVADVRFVVSVEQARAHLLASRELFNAGQASQAALLQAALKVPRREIDAKAPRERVEKGFDEAGARLTEAVARVVPESTASSLTFRSRVLGELLRGVETEYDEAYKGGRITQQVEYQDAWAFFQRARALHRELAEPLRAAAPEAAKLVEERLAILGRNFSALAPPASPMPIAALREHVEALTRALEKVRGWGRSTSAARFAQQPGRESRCRERCMSAVGPSFSPAASAPGASQSSIRAAI